MPPHKHCLLTPAGWVLIAEGVSDNAPNDPALENFHTWVHLGVPGGEPLTIVRINDRSGLLPASPAVGAFPVTLASYWRRSDDEDQPLVLTALSVRQRMHTT